MQELTHQAPPIAYHPSSLGADPQSITSGVFFRNMLELAPSSKVSVLEIVVHDPLRDFAANWMRVPQIFLGSFEKTPFTHLRELTYRFSTPPAISLLYDLLSFMPALRSLEVMAHIPRENQESAPDMPEVLYPRPPVHRLERLVYGTGLALQTLATRVIHPSADTLLEIDLYWHHPPKCAPALPHLPNVRSVVTTGGTHQAMHLIRQCPRLSHLKILMITREHLGPVIAALEDSGAQLCALDILPWRANLDVNDAAQLVSAIPGLPSLRRICIIARDIEDPPRLRETCRERRICLR